MAKSDLDNCDCCAGINQQTPVKLENLPSQTSISYRIGTHSRFKESMLAALTSAERPALLPLGTRDDDDFTIAYLDGVAMVLDVLTFYQERYINEDFLGTSTERRSVLEMAQLIGYRLSPGVAASTHLAFTLQCTPGTPTGSLDPISIPAGTRIQSVPGQDETPQVFETMADVEARANWNTVRVQTSVAYVPEHGDLDIYVDGVSSNIEAGDAILIVGQDRMDNSGSERWDIRIVKQVDIDNDHLRTRLVWDIPLGHTGPTIHPSDTNVRLFVFRKRSSLFGHNAPDPRLMSSNADNQLSHLVEGTGINLWWKNFKIIGDQIDLASPEEKVVAGGWVALVSNESNKGTADLPGYVELYRVDKVTAMSRTDYGISGKITRIKPDTQENLGEFRYRLRQTLALVASEELEIHRRPLRYPVFGDTLKFNNIIDGLVPGQYLSVSGRPQRLKVAPGVTGLSLALEDTDRELYEGDSVQLIATPQKISGSTMVKIDAKQFGEMIDSSDSTQQLKLQVNDQDGSTGSVTSHAADWVWDSNDDDPMVSEIAQIDAGKIAVNHSRECTTLSLTTALIHIYQRNSVRINFNVVPATHGETVTEILGDGDARETDQAFTLKHAPLTYVSADTPGGSAATLDVRVNDLRWNETTSLYQAAEDARVYQIRNMDNGSSVVRFGDGVEGGRLPTGQTNVRAVYRKYTGKAGNLDKDKLTTLLQKPLGVSEVTNPEASAGGADPEVIEDAKQNAPLTVLTLDRAVSVLDYQHYARAFAGIAKAHGLWISSGPSRGIYLTIAGIDGEKIPASGNTYKNLVKSLRRYGDPMLPLNLVNYRAVSFVLGLSVKVNEDADRDQVIEKLESALREHFSFARRDFGQHVSRDELLAVAHSVSDIEAVRISRFYKDVPGAVDTVESIIPSRLPIASLTEPPVAAELLTLSDAPLEIGAFS